MSSHRVPVELPAADLDSLFRTVMQLRERALQEEAATDPRQRTVTWQDLLERGVITEDQIPG